MRTCGYGLWVMGTCGKSVLIGIMNLGQKIEFIIGIFLAVVVLIVVVTQPSSDSEDQQDGQSK